MNLITIDEAASATGLSPSTLAKRRCTGTGPAFYKIGRQIRYERADVDNWIASRRRTCTWAANDNGRVARRLARKYAVPIGIVRTTASSKALAIAACSSNSQ